MERQLLQTESTLEDLKEAACSPALFGIRRDFWGHLSPVWDSNRTSVLLCIFILDLMKLESDLQLNLYFNIKLMFIQQQMKIVSW